MIKRIYIDNYKCLTNFECSFDNINLILGANGSGKSTVFEAIYDVRNFVNGQSPIRVFKDATLTRWQTSSLQEFDIEIEGNGGIYTYHLGIEHEIGKENQSVSAESVRYNGHLLYDAVLDEVQLFRDDFTSLSIYPKNSTQSGLLSLGEREDNTRITWLKRWFRNKLFCVQIDPLGMKSMAGSMDPELDIHAWNFVGWYRHRISADMNATIELYNALKPMYDDFGGLTLEREGGDVQHLFVTLGVREGETEKPANTKYSFADLSDGERSLFVLYALLQLLSDPEVTICLDEPDNYLSLLEIQPWLLKMEEQIEDNASQVLIISHHPEIMNYFAQDNGIVFVRSNNNQTRVDRYTGDMSGLPPSELFARGDVA
jgi:predicted ATPase